MSERKGERGNEEFEFDSALPLFYYDSGRAVIGWKGQFKAMKESG